MENFLFHAHSGVRWLVVALTILAFVWLMVRYLQNQSYDKRTHIIVAAWAGMVGLQWLLGIVLLLVLGTYTNEQWVHAILGTLVLAVAHGYVPLKKRPDKVRFTGGIASILIVAVLVYVSVAVVGGWS